MPNRADQSVKTRKRVRRNVVKGYAIAVGTGLAGIGALAVMLAGGPAGILLAAGILTILIILQISLLVSRSDSHLTKAYKDEIAPVRPASQYDTGGLPFLIINVSEMGRVRAIWGQEDYIDGLRIGRVLEEVLPADATNVDAASDQARLIVSRYPTDNGAWVTLIPASEEGREIEAELRERTHFFAGLGHDLKSPLNAVIGFADIMDAEIRGPMPEAYREYPGLIRESGQTLLQLVEDILTYARSEAGTYELDLAPMDIAASGESVLRQSQAMADAADVALKMDGDGEVLALADAGAVRRIWDNLVSNAIKYSSPGDTVTLRANVRGGQAILSVIDTGTGMDAEDLQRIARPFAQGRNAKGRAGTGLGLALVHRLAQLHGGKVRIATSPGKGTSVTVSLPAVQPDQKRAAE